MRAPVSENQQYDYAKPKAQISCAVTAQLISTVFFFFFFFFFFFVTLRLQFFSYLIPKFKDNPASVAVQSGLCQTWSETPIVGFLMQRLIPKLKFLPRGF